MSIRNYQSLPCSDAQLLTSIRSLANEFGLKTPDLTIALASDGGGASIRGRLEKLDSDQAYQALAASNLALIHTVSLNENSQRLFFVTRRSGVHEITFDIDPNGDSRSIITRLVALQEKFPPLSPPATTGEVLGPALKEFYRHREEVLVRLEKVHAEAISSMAAHRAQLDSEFKTRAEGLRLEVERERQRLESIHQERVAEVEKREQELALREKSLDDRDSKHVRRETISQTKKLLAQQSENFQLSKTTARKRVVIHAVFVLLLAATSVALTKALLNLPSATDEWVAWVRLPVIVLAFFGSAVFYIRWNDAWFRQHADAEFRLKRFALDLDRAAYAVELALEWADEKRTEVQTLIMDRITRSLFEEASASDAPKHPIEDLLERADIELRLPGLARARIDRRDSRRK